MDRPGIDERMNGRLFVRNPLLLHAEALKKAQSGAAMFILLPKYY
jgi:hypothetical protein